MVIFIILCLVSLVAIIFGIKYSKEIDCCKNMKNSDIIKSCSCKQDKPLINFNEKIKIEPEIKEFIQDKKESKMTITQFQSLIAKAEGKKREVPIGNVREVLKLVNLQISRVSKEDLEFIIKNSKGHNVSNLLYKIIKRL